MLVVNRFIVPDGSDAEDFEARASMALDALAERPGYLRGRLGRAYDDPAHWALVTEWESVGAYRRALGDFQVKMHATPLLAQSVDEPSAYEELLTVAAGGATTRSASDRSGTGERPINSHT